MGILERIQLILDNRNDHVHLFSHSWGSGDEDLSEDKVNNENDLAHHLKLIEIDNEDS